MKQDRTSISSTWPGTEPLSVRTALYWNRYFSIYTCLIRALIPLALRSAAWWYEPRRNRFFIHLDSSYCQMCFPGMRPPRTMWSCHWLGNLFTYSLGKLEGFTLLLGFYCLPCSCSQRLEEIDRAKLIIHWIYWMISLLRPSLISVLEPVRASSHCLS